MSIDRLINLRCFENKIYLYHDMQLFDVIKLLFALIRGILLRFGKIHII